MSAFPASLALRRARTLLKAITPTGGLFDWTRVGGRIVEVSEEGCFGTLSALVGLMAQVQARSEAIAWIAIQKSIFFPPDLAFRGLDLQAITVVRLTDSGSGLRAADWLLRSGAFGLLILDGVGLVEESTLGRLARVAQGNATTVLFLTQKKPDDPSLGSQIALRGTVRRLGPGEIEWQIVRDKSAGTLNRQKGTFLGPCGVY